MKVKEKMKHAKTQTLEGCLEEFNDWLEEGNSEELRVNLSAAKHTVGEVRGELMRYLNKGRRDKYTVRVGKVHRQRFGHFDEASLTSQEIVIREKGDGNYYRIDVSHCRHERKHSQKPDTLTFVVNRYK